MAHPEGPSQMTIPLSFLRYDGGINTRYSTLSLEENEVFDMENFHLEARGGLEKRKGYEFLFADDTATGDPINGLYHFKPTNDVVRVEDGSVAANNGSGWVDITGTLTVSADPDDLWQFATYKDTMVGTNGVDVPMKWDGTGNAEEIDTAIGVTGDSILTARLCIQHRDRIIYADVTTDEGGTTRYASRLWPSAVNTVDEFHSDFTDGKIVDIDEGDGDDITALAEAAGYLVIFKDNSLHRINDYGLPGVSQRIKVANVGAPGPFAVCTIGNIVFFHDIVGQLWAYDAKGTNQDSVINLSERKLGKETLDSFNKTRLTQSHLWPDPVRNELRSWITTVGETETNLTWTFNLTSGGFGKLRYTDTMNISARYVDDSGEIRCIVGTYAGEVFLLDEGEEDNEVAYDAYVVTRWLDFGDSGMIKGTRMMHLYGTVVDTQDVTIEHRVQLEGSGPNYTATLNGPGAQLDLFVLDEDTLGGSGDSLAKVRIESYSRWHQFKITQSEAAFLRIIGFVLMVVTAGREQDAA